MLCVFTLLKSYTFYGLCFFSLDVVLIRRSCAHAAAHCVPGSKCSCLIPVLVLGIVLIASMLPLAFCSEIGEFGGPCSSSAPAYVFPSTPGPLSHPPWETCLFYSPFVYASVAGACFYSMNKRL